jgi:hypothetical protein
MPHRREPRGAMHAGNRSTIPCRSGELARGPQHSPHTHQLNGTRVDVARDDREGREGTSHLDYTSLPVQRVDVM